MGKEGKRRGEDMRRRRGKEAAMEEEEDAAPPTGCWIRLPRLGGGCMSSGSKVDSSTSGACGNGGVRLMATGALYDDMASKQGSSAAKAAAADCDPVYEWVDSDGSYLLRLTLPGFKKEDFRVHVDPTGRLTIIGHRPVDGVAGSVRLHKVFQLPPTSDLDGITGRYDGSVLTLTVPKLPSSAVPPPETPIERVKEAAADVAEKPTDKKSRVGREAKRLIEAARARLQGRQKEEAAKEQTAGSSKKSPATKVDGKKEEPKPEVMSTPAEQVMKQEDDHDEKAKAAEQRAKLEREAERRIEAARARLHAAEREAEREREKNGCWDWKERATEEGLKWAEAIGNNKEVIATAVAAFTLGVFVSHRLFSRI